MTVVVVGGGIVGLATAYYLTERDPGREVLVCEKGSVGAGSTERAVGGIRAQFSTKVNVRLSLAAMEVWDTFEEEFGVDIEHRRFGYLFLAREEETAADLEDTVAMQQGEGVTAQPFTPTEATQFADIDPDRFRLAAYSARDGVADPHLALQGFSTAAREGGATIRTNTGVTDIEHADDGGWTVELASEGTERIKADYIVNAAGPWARRVGALVGLDLPVSPERRQVATVVPERPVPKTVPLTFDMDTGSYFLPDREGDALVGGHFEETGPTNPDDYDTGYDVDWAVEAVERAGDYAGYFGPDTRIKNGWAGLYAVTPDHHPIIEESLPGFVNAVGFSGHGFMHAPATGQVITELVTDGAASTVDVSPLALARFEDGSESGERNVL